MKEKDFTWVRNVIIGCKSPFQYEACENLINSYMKMYENYPNINDDYHSLMTTLDETFLPVEVKGL